MNSMITKILNGTKRALMGAATTTAAHHALKPGSGSYYGMTVIEKDFLADFVIKCDVISKQCYELGESITDFYAAHGSPRAQAEIKLRRELRVRFAAGDQTLTDKEIDKAFNIRRKRRKNPEAPLEPMN